MTLNVPWRKPGDEGDPCCCPEEDCCLYPWPDPDGIVAGPYYPETDLPDSVVAGIYGTLLHVSGTYYFTPDGTLDLTGLYIEASLIGEYWNLNDPTVSITHALFSSACLIGEWGDSGGYDFSDPPQSPPMGWTSPMTFEDEFADTYTATYGAYDPITITRQNLCEWTGNGVGTEAQAYTVRVYYDPATYKWRVEVIIEETTNFDWVKDDPQSSPEGDFEGNLVVTP